ncbi:MAG: copper transporter, partial [Actinomyces graevenitzii]|nr:copper transporter [Actinomyces graevenitzii]
MGWPTPHHPQYLRTTTRIDFRYHLVSLIAVFMALAVGVVLGAGPLQGTLGSALSDQVT